MASDKQIQANRLNAMKSTGPQSPEGKQRVARNRTTHGLAGEHVVLANEDPSSFDNLLAILVADWDPRSETEAFLVETLAYNEWRLLRIGRMERASNARKLESEGEVRLSMEVEDLSRYEGRSSRAYYRALNMLIKLQAARQKQQRQQQQDSTPRKEEKRIEGNRPVTVRRRQDEEPPVNQPVVALHRNLNPISPGDSPGQPPLLDAA